MDDYRNVCYLIHFDEPLNAAGMRHYVGFAPVLSDRIAKHRASKGAAATARANALGIGWRVVRVWRDADRDAEKALKKLGGVNLCPHCSKLIPRSNRLSQGQGPHEVRSI